MDDALQTAAEKEPNPLYILMEAEVRTLLSLYISDIYQGRNKLWLGHAVLRDDIMNVEEGGQSYRQYIKSEWKRALADPDTDKLIVRFSTDSTMKVPHHIHRDGNFEEIPGREGPLRTYYDGSFIEHLGHAVAVCVDKIEGSITTQCPRGKDISPLAEEMLSETFAGFTNTAVREVQQTDVHSCMFYTLKNIFAFAGMEIMPADGCDNDVKKLRKAILNDIDYICRISQPLSEMITGMRNKEQKGIVPVYRLPYLQP